MRLIGSVPLILQLIDPHLLRHVLSEEREFLRKASADDHVAIVQTHGYRLPIVDFLPNALINRTIELARKRRPAHLRLPLSGKARTPRRGHDDAARTFIVDEFGDKKSAVPATRT